MHTYPQLLIALYVIFSNVEVRQTLSFVFSGGRERECELSWK